MVEKHKIFFAVVFIGFVLGILYTNLFASDYLVMTGVFSDYYLQEFLNSTVIIEECLFYILKVRVLPLIMIVMLAYSRINKIGVVIFLAWTGFLWGIYMALGVLQLGFQGVIFCVLGMLPQIIFYIPAYLIIMIFAYKYPGYHWNGMKIGVVILCMISGVILECQVNSQVLKWFITMVLY